MMNSSNPEHAIAVSVDIARGCGITVEKPVPLRSTHNAVAWLCPAPIVAKVGVGRHSRLRTELRMALELGALGASVVLPAAEPPPVVHSRQGLEVTFWRYHAQDSSVEIPARRIAEALTHLHAALAQISPALRASLPRYLQEPARARSLLAEPGGLPALCAADRQLLADTFDRLQDEMLALAGAEDDRVLHGSPHAYNVLLVDGEVVFIDLETACTGPVEWDLAHLDREGELGYGVAMNPRLLWLCRGMVSVKTAIWCWADIERGDLREHAEWHLARVRTSVAPELASSRRPLAE